MKKKKNIPGHPGDETPGGSRRRGKASTVFLRPRNYKTTSATTSVQSLRHPHHPSSLPEGVQFQLYTLPVTAWCVGDGDGFTAHVEQDSKVVNGSNNGEILARKYRIRMRGIDAPELEMEYGKEARNELVNLIEGKRVMIYVYGQDKHERYIGDIYCGAMFIQEEMLKRGFAWYCKIYDKRCEFEQWEREARDARRGLWLSDNPKKPWEWKRDHPRNAKKQDGIQMDNGSCEALSRMIKEKKNYEEKAAEWKNKWESVVVENQMLNDRLRESKEALSRMIQEKKNSEEKATEWKKKWESVVAENQMLNDRLRESKEALSRMIQEKNNSEEKATEWKKKWESVVAENQKLNHRLRESKEALSTMIQEKNNSEEKATECKKKRESVVAENHMLIRELKDVLQNEEKACKQHVKRRAIWVGTSMLAVGIAVLCIKWKTPPKKNGGALLSHFTRTMIW